jgi:hypothetical protein
MRLNLLEDCPLVQPVRAGFRGGSIGFRDLMMGTEGDPGNYGLQLVHINEAYFTPQHRHNFEQVRIMLEGSFSFGKGLEQHQGSAGYFCEGTYYTQQDLGPSTTLLLQIGGPSKQGFMSRAQLRRGIDELASKGQFKDGVFTWLDKAGKKHNQDSYEAVWEHVNGKGLNYPQPQFRTPVLLETERFTWREVGKAVRARHFASFNEYGLGLVQLELEAGAKYHLVARASQLLFCDDGEGSVNARPYQRWSTIQLNSNEAAHLHARTTSRFYVFNLPSFD